jgi:hypothetical protein
VNRQLKQPNVRLEEDRTDQEFAVRIWLEQCEGINDEGLLLGTGPTKAEALLEARESLSEAAKQLEHLEHRA